MARPANRYLKESLNSKKTKNDDSLYVAKYLRLSVDSDYTGSDSIENQRRLINDYLKRFCNIKYEEEYVDNGISGTLFKRPAFEKLIQDMKEGLINCIVVKDLSRFGRGYLEVGNYIEKVFPFMKVRFISINDNYDSFNLTSSDESFYISLKNLINEAYTLDISTKVSSIYKYKQNTNEFYRTSIVPYGYSYNSKKKYYEINTETAPIVRDIFLKYSQGMSKHSICKYLIEQNVAPPKQHNTNSKVKLWYVSTIDRILKNEIYIGTVVRHKTETEISKDKKYNKVPEESWVKILNMAEPIIEKDIFLKVQDILNNTKQKYLSSRKISLIQKKDCRSRNVFKGKIFCGDCGNSMEYITRYKNQEGKIFSYKAFQCSTYRRIPELCSTKYIEEDVLYELLQNIICSHIKLVEKWKQIIDNNIKYSLDFKLNQLKNEKLKLCKSKINAKYNYFDIYDKYTDREINYNDFLINREKYNSIYYTYEKKINTINLEEKRLSEYQIALEKLILLWLSYDVNKKLTEEATETLIERVYVFKDKHVNVKLKYNDCFQLLENYTNIKGDIL